MKATLRWQLGLVSLLVTLGCSPRPPVSDEAGVTTDPGGSSESSGTTGGQKLDLGGSEDEGGKLDVAPIGDLPQCWTTYYMTLEEANAAHPDCVLELFSPDAEFAEMCVDRPVGGSCADICPTDQLCEGMNGSVGCPWTDWYQLCGPYETADSCCLLLEVGVPQTTC
jgi:hypothetical protein